MHLTTAQAIVFLAGVVIPFVVDLVTKSKAPAWVKSVLAFALAALAGAVTTSQLLPGERWQDYVLTIASAWALALVTHYSGVTAGVQRSTAAFGIGPADPAGHLMVDGLPVLDAPGDVVTQPTRQSDAPAPAAPVVP